MNKKKTIIIVAGICAIVLIAAGGSCIYRKHQQRVPEQMEIFLLKMTALPEKMKQEQLEIFLLKMTALPEKMKQEQLETRMKVQLGTMRGRLILHCQVPAE